MFTNSQGSATTNAAILTVMAPQPASVSGVVYDDKKGIGVDTRKDAGLADVAVTIKPLSHGKHSGKGQSTITNGKGDYMFSNLTAGESYQVSETLPKGFTLTQPSSGMYRIYLTSNQNLSGENFGNHPSKAKKHVVRFSDQAIVSAGQTSLDGIQIAGAEGILESIWSLE